MAFTYTQIDGQRVEMHVANAFYALAAEFKRVFGLTLHVRSGTRTRQEQQVLYSNYLKYGRPLAAKPGQSNHEEYGPTGPRALDVYDSGGDAGVTVAGSVRGNWLKANAFRFGFNPAGYGFSQVEPWHIEYTGSLDTGAPAYNPGDKLVVDGNLGPATISKLQSVLGANVDGQMGPQTISKLQERLHVPVDGQLGPVTISEMQRRIGANVDGDWGPNTTTKLQEHLNAGGTLQAVINPDAPLVVDGQLGVATISKLQKVLGAAVDGQWGPDTTSKLQAAVGTTVDGQLGPQTIKALQINVGATVDGAMGPNTITKLQEFLNAGKTFTKVEIPAEVQPPQPTQPATPDNPRGLKTYQPFNPRAFIGLEAPLGDGVRGFKGDPPVKVPVIIDRAILHRTGTNVDQADWFSYKNSRTSCPNWYVRKDGSEMEFIRPGRKPALTGPEWNWRSVGWEVLGDGDGTEQQFETIARDLAWLAFHDGKLLDGVPVEFKLDRVHFVNHREVLPGTECPGDWWADRMDALLDRAKVYLKVLQEAPGEVPTPEEPEEPLPDTELNDAIKAKYAELGNLIKELE